MNICRTRITVEEDKLTREKGCWRKKRRETKKRRGSRNLKRQRDLTRGKGRKRVNIADDENVPGGWKVAHDKKLPNGWKNEVDPPNTHKTKKNNSEEETSSGQSQAKIITEDERWRLWKTSRSSGKEKKGKSPRRLERMRL